jgi:lipopolysaccharide export system protein LptA
MNLLSCLALGCRVSKRTLLRGVACATFLLIAVPVFPGQADNGTPPSGQEAQQGKPRLQADADKPIDIESDGGFEFYDRQEMVIARGRAVVSQDGMVLKADLVAAYFRKRPQGGSEIFRLLAQGRVEIEQDDHKAFADQVIYDVDQAVAVMTGRSLRLIGSDGASLTAAGSMEYWRDRKLAVASGDAVATRGDQRLRADRLVALVAKRAPAEGGRVKDQPVKVPAVNDGAKESDPWALRRVEAKGRVVIATAKETAKGDEGLYDVDQDRALLVGNVRISRGSNQLNGPAAEVDLKGGVSRLLPRDPRPVAASASSTVPQRPAQAQGLFIPDAPRPKSDKGSAAP